MKKKYFIYAILPIMAFAISGAVYATVNSSESSNPMSDLVNAIAQKFNLNTSDVQAVFDEQKAKMDTQREEKRAEMETKRQQEFTDRINQAVLDGKLTQDQADKIVAKKAEIEAQRISKDSQTEVDKQAAMNTMKEQMDSLKQWATDNNIPQEYIMFGGFGVGRGHGRPGGPGFGVPEPAAN